MYCIDKKEHHIHLQSIVFVEEWKIPNVRFYYNYRYAKYVKTFYKY